MKADTTIATKTLAWLKKARKGPAFDFDRPPPSTFPGPKVKVHEQQMRIDA